MVETIAITPTVTCRVTVRLATMCPIRDETDRYDVTVTWRTTETTYEKHALRSTILAYAGDTLTQEALCASLHDELTGDDAPMPTVRVQDVEHMDMVAEK